jgi:hypothetical protein
MKLNNIHEMVSEYERLTNEKVNLSKFKWVDKVGFVSEDKFHLKIIPNGGFFIWALAKRDGVKFLQLDQFYGFVKSVVPYLKEVMHMNGLTTIITTTQRNPAAHIRKWKMKHLEKYDYDYEGRHYYVLQGTIDNFH